MSNETIIILQFNVGAHPILMLSIIIRFLNFLNLMNDAVYTIQVKLLASCAPDARPVTTQDAYSLRMKFKCVTFSVISMRHTSTRSTETRIPFPIALTMTPDSDRDKIKTRKTELSTKKWPSRVPPIAMCRNNIAAVCVMCIVQRVSNEIEWNSKYFLFIISSHFPNGSR